MARLKPLYRRIIKGGRSFQNFFISISFSLAQLVTPCHRLPVATDSPKLITFLISISFNSGLLRQPGKSPVCSDSSQAYELAGAILILQVDIKTLLLLRARGQCERTNSETIKSLGATSLGEPWQGRILFVTV